MNGGASPSALSPGAYGRSALLINRLTSVRTWSHLEEFQMFDGLFQPIHLLVIVGIALLVFGPKKLPELGKGLGESIRGFKAAMKESGEEKPENKLS